MIKLTHLMDGDSFSVLAVFSPNIASLGLVLLAHLFIAAAHSIPHSGIFGSRENCSTIVIKGIIVHILEFICLSKAVPCSEVFWINLDCTSISLYRPRYVFHFKVLMSHQCPCCQASSIEFECLSKIDDSFEMFTH